MNQRPDMRDFQNHLEIPDLTTVPVTRPGPACTGGMLSCAQLSEVDSAATDKLLRFLTQMTQGFSGYVEAMKKTTQTYEEGARYTEDDMRNVLVYSPLLHPPLPDVAPELSPPAGPRDA